MATMIASSFPLAHPSDLSTLLPPIANFDFLGGSLTFPSFTSLRSEEQSFNIGYPAKYLPTESEIDKQSKRSREDKSDDKSERKKRRASVTADVTESDLELSELENMPSSPVHQSQPSSPSGSSKKDAAIINQLKFPKKMSKEWIVAQSTCPGNGSCELCKSGTPYYLHSSMNPGWRESILAIFQFFPKRRTKTEWLRIQRSGEDTACSEDNGKNETEWLYFPDAYPFVENHWNYICPPQHKDRSFTELNWRKTMQDTFSHNRTYFSSGKKVFGRTGFWRISDKAPLHNILKESNRVQVEKLTSKSQQATQTIQAVAVPDQTTPICLLPLVASSEEAWRAQPIAEVKPANKVSDAKADFSNLSFLLDAIDALQNSV